MLDIIIGISEQGLIYGIMALGIYISYKILDFPDLSADGTFPLGAAVTATLLLLKVNPFAVLLIAFLCGALAGVLTGIFHVYIRVKDLLSGILTMTLLYSVNYRIVGSPNKFLMGENTVFESAKKIFPESMSAYVPLIVILMIVLFVKILLDLYLKTKSGFVLKCVGSNKNLVVTMALNPGKYKILGLALANGLIALSGALYCQRINQFDISIGVGTMVMGLAAVIMGTTIFRRNSFVKTTTAVIIGMIIYKGCITLAISSGLQSSDMNFVITVLFIITLVLNRMKERVK